MATFSDILVKVETQLSLLGGIDVQTYGQPKLAAKLQATFNEVFDKRFWKDHLVGESFTLDANGVSTTDLTNKIKRFGDIQYVWLNSWREPLPEAPQRMNPALVLRPCFAAYNNATAGRFKVLKANAGDLVYVQYRTKPADFVDDDEVPFDVDYLMFKVSADYLIDEGANNAAAQKFEQKAMERYKTLVDIETNNEYEMHSYVTSYPTEWR